jgi:hypothetical protein
VDDKPSGSVPDPLRAALEPWADLSRRVAEFVQSATVSGLARTPGSELLTRYAEQISAIPRLWVEPLRRIVEEQRRMAELMATWAKQHAEMAKQLADSAEHLRRLSEEGAAMIDPILTYTEKVSDVTDSWIDALRPKDPS